MDVEFDQLWSPIIYMNDDDDGEFTLSVLIGKLYILRVS